MCFSPTILAPTRHVAASDLDLKTVLQGASAAAASVQDRDMIEKVAALGEVARAQAAAGDRDGARGSVDIAFRATRSVTSPRRSRAPVAPRPP
jgi:hypothetical protein